MWGSGLDVSEHSSMSRKHAFGMRPTETNSLFPRSGSDKYQEQSNTRKLFKLTFKFEAEIKFDKTRALLFILQGQLIPTENASRPQLKKNMRAKKFDFHFLNGLRVEVLTMLKLVLVLVALVVLFLAVRFFVFWRRTLAIAEKNLPVIVVPFGVGNLTMILDILLSGSSFRTGNFWWLTNVGLQHHVKAVWRANGYCDTVCLLSFYPMQAVFIVTDSALAREISELQETIAKEVEAYKILEYFGEQSVLKVCFSLFFFFFFSLFFSFFFSFFFPRFLFNIK